MKKSEVLHVCDCLTSWSNTCTEHRYLCRMSQLLNDSEICEKQTLNKPQSRVRRPLSYYLNILTFLPRLTGMLLHYNGKFLQTEKRLSQQEARALSSLMNSLKSVYISTEQQCMLFDSMVGSVLSYASEIWGFHRAHDIEVIHNRFCRFVFKIVKMYLLLFCMVNLAICQCIFLDVSEF